MDPKEPAPTRASTPLLGVALVVWALLTFGHKTGLEMAGRLFAWAQRPGSLTEVGGSSGQARLELLLTAVFLLIGVAIMVNVVWRLRGLRPGLRALAEEAVTWAAWACGVLLIWKCCIVYATEFVHFAQYALIGCLFHLALRGQRPQLAFLITFGLGFVDELWQHYGIHVLDKQDAHQMDWSDEVLDGLGAVGGILPFVTLHRLRGEEAGPDTTPLLRRAVLCAAALLLPLLLLDPVTQAAILGNYPSYWPVWGEYLNHKPTHWPAPRQGIPLLLGSLYLLGLLVERRRQVLGQGGALLLAALLLVSVQPYSRRDGMPLHEVVPALTIPRAKGPIAIDGRIDEAEWAGAARIDGFKLANSRMREVQAARHPTQARLLWDDQALYVAFECQDEDVWCREAAKHDDRALPGDEVVELFLDDGGDEVTYVEVEVSPANVTYDLWNFIPSGPIDHDPYQRFIGLYQWEAQGLETAVQVQGTLDRVAEWGPVEPADRDQGWSAELRFPWEALRTTTTPSPPNTIRATTQPKPGDRWRLNLCRVERKRPTPAEWGPPYARIGAEQARAILGGAQGPLSEGDWQQVLRDGLLKLQPEGDLFQQEVVRLAYQRPAFGVVELQAWSPTWRADGGYHEPRFFGAVTFGE